MRAEWNQRAKEDAHYYVAFGRRDQDDQEFLSTAKDLVGELIAELKRLPDCDRKRRRALEIGCGPGRLLRPMSQYFGQIYGVDVSDADLATINQKIKSDFQTEYPGVLVDASGATADKMNVHITRFDRGNAFARAMLIGMGQIHIEGTVDVVDGSGKAVAEYNVSKDFAIGGVIGGATSVEDVEDGFAKSVAAIVNPKG